MAGGAQPDPIGLGEYHVEIDSGTMALTASPLPGPLGLSGPEPVRRPDDFLDRDNLMNGAIPFSIGLASLVRIPIPGTNGLCIEFNPRGWVPKGGSTSSLFFQDITGKRHLRLDFGYNVKTKTLDYHWNQQKSFGEFGIADHTPAGSSGRVAFQTAKYFRYAGRVLMVAGIALEVIAVVQADKPLRRASQAVAGWASAWAGCKLVGAGGAALGTLASPLGAAVGGVGGCIIGGIGGYYAGSEVAGIVFDWAEGTTFTALPEATAP